MRHPQRGTKPKSLATLASRLGRPPCPSANGELTDGHLGRMVSPRLGAGPIRDYPSPPSLYSSSPPCAASTTNPSYSFVINCSHGGKIDMGSMQAAVSSAVQGILPSPPTNADPTPRLPANDLRRKLQNHRPTSGPSAPDSSTASIPRVVFAAPPIVSATSDSEHSAPTSVASKRRQRFHRALARDAQQRNDDAPDKWDYLALHTMVKSLSSQVTAQAALIRAAKKATSAPPPCGPTPPTAPLLPLLPEYPAPPATAPAAVPATPTPSMVGNFVDGALAVIQTRPPTRHRSRSRSRPRPRTPRGWSPPLTRRDREPRRSRDSRRSRSASRSRSDWEDTTSSASCAGK
jgi:hypothetical protein